MKRLSEKSGQLRLDREIACARSRWAANFAPEQERLLRTIIQRTGLLVTGGEIQVLDGTLYVNHSGLLRLARINRCAGIETMIVESLSRPDERRWVVKATVFKSARSTHGFVGLGDADPGNIASLIRGSELRMAETRAVNRALRKAYAVGLCSLEEIGSSAEKGIVWRSPELRVQAEEPGVGAMLPMPVGDRLKLILREHQLDPVQVLQYAYRFLGISDLKASPPEELERFVSHLEQFAIANRAWLNAELSRVIDRRVSRGSPAMEAA